MRCGSFTVPPDSSFTDWLFAEAAKGAPESEAPSAASSTPVEIPNESKPVTQPPSSDPARRPPNGPRAGAPLYQQAISSALPSTSQKRLRSPSPSAHPAKSRRTDLPPTGPRAMQNPAPAQRSLLDRVGGPGPGARFQGGRDEVQVRIDNITNASPDPSAMMSFPNGMGMPDMAVGMGMQANPLMLQEMMLSQMALMAQMANSMGMLNPGMGMPGFNPMQQGGDAAMFNGGAGVNGHSFPQNGVNGRGRGAARGGRGRGGSRGGHMGSSPAPPSIEEVPTPVSVPASVIAEPAQSTPIAAPIPLPASAVSSNAPLKPAYALPERPQSPTLCKFGIKCTNSQCRYSHPSPVATAESGVVLSTEACEKGKDCKDKDCIKSHVSPAVKNPGTLVFCLCKNNTSLPNSRRRNSHTSPTCHHYHWASSAHCRMSFRRCLHTPKLPVHASSKDKSLRATMSLRCRLYARILPLPTPRRAGSPIYVSPRPVDDCTPCKRTGARDGEHGCSKSSQKRHI